MYIQVGLCLLTYFPIYHLLLICLWHSSGVYKHSIFIQPVLNVFLCRIFKKLIPYILSLMLTFKTYLLKLSKTHFTFPEKKKIVQRNLCLSTAWVFYSLWLQFDRRSISHYILKINFLKLKISAQCRKLVEYLKTIILQVPLPGYNYCQHFSV